MTQIDYCELTAEQYDNMTAEQYDGMIECSLAGGSATYMTPKEMRRQSRINRLGRLRPALRPILIPYLTLEELEAMGEGEML